MNAQHVYHHKSATRRIQSNRHDILNSCRVAFPRYSGWSLSSVTNSKPAAVVGHGKGNTNPAIPNGLLQLDETVTACCHFTKTENHKSLELTNTEA